MELAMRKIKMIISLSPKYSQGEESGFGIAASGNKVTRLSIMNIAQSQHNNQEACGTFYL